MTRRRLSKRYRLMLRWGVPCVLAALGLSYLAFLGSARKDPSAPDKDGTIGGLTSVLERDISSEMARFLFDDVTKETGIDFRHFPTTRQSLLPEDMGSGLAWGDYDGDGRMDLAIMVHGGKPIILHNTSPETGHWIGLRLRQQGGNTFALGACVALRTGQHVQTAQVGANGSYLSQSPTELHFGLADAETVDSITIRWPDGAEDRYETVAGDQVIEYSHTMPLGVAVHGAKP